MIKITEIRSESDVVESKNVVCVDEGRSDFRDMNIVSFLYPMRVKCITGEVDRTYYNTNKIHYAAKNLENTDYKQNFSLRFLTHDPITEGYLIRNENNIRDSAHKAHKRNEYPRRLTGALGICRKEASNSQAHHETEHRNQVRQQEGHENGDVGPIVVVGVVRSASPSACLCYAC